MKKGTAGVFALVGLAFGAGLMGSPALARCGRDCTRAIAVEFKACKVPCPKGRAGKACKTTCKDEKKADTAACKAATNPTPPGCGEKS